MKKIMDKPVNPVFVMIFLFIVSLVGLLFYIQHEKNRADENKTFFDTTLKVALEEGVSKDILKKALFESDTLR